MRIDPKAIERLLWHRGLSQKDVAASAGITETHMSRLMAGAYRGSPATARKLADALDVEPADIVTDDEEPEAVSA